MSKIVERKLAERDGIKSQLLLQAIKNWQLECPHLRHNFEQQIKLCIECLVDLTDDASLLCGHKQIGVYCIPCKKGDACGNY